MYSMAPLAKIVGIVVLLASVTSASIFKPITLQIDQNLNVQASGAADKLNPFHKLEPDAFADPPQLIRSRQFIPETHFVLTKDNYILTLHRIVNPLVPLHLRSALKPVLMQHGIFTSSSNFILNSDLNTDRPRFEPRDLTRTTPRFVYTPEPPFSWQRILENINDLTWAQAGLTDSSDRMQAPFLSDSLGFEMANQGYDVWLGNYRGTHQCLNHTRYDARNDWRYWDFSFHEMGLYDLPALMNYILRNRRRSSLAFIGHSQGNLGMFILQSLHPEWARKVKPFIAVSPVVFIPNLFFGIARPLFKLVSLVATPTRLNQVIKGEMFPKTPITGQTLDLVCRPKLTTLSCDILLAAMLGDSLKRSNHSRTAILAHQLPDSTSILNVLHLAQFVISGQFKAFDFGPQENLRRYGSTVNPSYPIKNIASRDIAFVYGRTDTLATKRDVEFSRSMLNVPLMDEYLVPELVWGHSDYIYSNGAGRQANSHIIGLVDRYRLVP